MRFNLQPNLWPAGSRGLACLLCPPSPDLLSLDVYTAYPLSSWRFESNCQSTTVARLMRSMTRCWTASSKRPSK